MPIVCEFRTKIWLKSYWVRSNRKIRPEMIDRVERLVLNDRRIKVVQLASECGTSLSLFNRECLDLAQSLLYGVHYNKG